MYVHSKDSEYIHIKEDFYHFVRYCKIERIEKMFIAKVKFRQERLCVL